MAAVAVVLACIGLYALSSLDVRRQRPELAARIVLGASPAALSRSLWTRSLVPVLGGLGLGAALVAIARPAVQSRVALIDATTADAALAAACLLASVVLALLPGIRLAQRTDPNELMRVP